jgi:hypothetical protein
MKQRQGLDNDGRPRRKVHEKSFVVAYGKLGRPSVLLDKGKARRAPLLHTRDIQGGYVILTSKRDKYEV